MSTSFNIPRLYPVSSLTTNKFSCQNREKGTNFISVIDYIKVHLQPTLSVGLNPIKLSEHFNT